MLRVIISPCGGGGILVSPFLSPAGLAYFLRSPPVFSLDSVVWQWVWFMILKYPGKSFFANWISGDNRKLEKVHCWPMLSPEIIRGFRTRRNHRLTTCHKYEFWAARSCCPNNTSGRPQRLQQYLSHLSFSCLDFFETKWKAIVKTKFTLHPPPIPLWSSRKALPRPPTGTRRSTVSLPLTAPSPPSLYWRTATPVCCVLKER